MLTKGGGVLCCTKKHPRRCLMTNPPPQGDTLVPSKVQCSFIRSDQVTGWRVNTAVTTRLTSLPELHFLSGRTHLCDCTGPDLWHRRQIKAPGRLEVFLRAKQTGLWHSQRAGVKQLPGSNCAALGRTSCDTCRPVYASLPSGLHRWRLGLNTGVQRGAWTSVTVVCCPHWANQQKLSNQSWPKKLRLTRYGIILTRETSFPYFQAQTWYNSSIRAERPRFNWQRLTFAQNKQPLMLKIKYYPLAVLVQWHIQKQPLSYWQAVYSNTGYYIGCIQIRHAGLRCESFCPQGLRLWNWLIKLSLESCGQSVWRCEM